MILETENPQEAKSVCSGQPARLLRLIQVDALRRVHTVGFLVERLIQTHVDSPATCTYDCGKQHGKRRTWHSVFKSIQYTFNHRDDLQFYLNNFKVVCCRFAACGKGLKERRVQYLYQETTRGQYRFIFSMQNKNIQFCFSSNLLI